MELRWNSSLQTSSNEVNPQFLVIKGVLIDNSVNKNGWAVSEEDLPMLAKQVAGLQLRCDHSNSVRDVIGGMKIGEYDKVTKKVMFEAEVDDPTIARLVARGRLKNVSIGAQAKSICSVCGKPNRPKACKCEGSHSVIKDFLLKEVSIITEPAYGSAEFSPVSFAASVEKELESSLQKEEKVLIEETKVEPLEDKKIMEEKRVTDEIKPETKPVEVVAKIDPEFMKILASLVESNKAYLAKCKEEEEEEAKKKEEDEAKKKEALKLEEAMKPLKEEIAKLKEELAKKEKPPVEDEEEKKETKVATAGAKIETVTTAETKPKDVYTAGLEDIRKAAKDLNIVP